jgi:hypothetical protein
MTWGARTLFFISSGKSAMLGFVLFGEELMMVEPASWLLRPEIVWDPSGFGIWSSRHEAPIRLSTRLRARFTVGTKQPAGRCLPSSFLFSPRPRKPGRE